MQRQAPIRHPIPSPESAVPASPIKRSGSQASPDQFERAGSNSPDEPLYPPPSPRLRRGASLDSPSRFPRTDSRSPDEPVYGPPPPGRVVAIESDPAKGLRLSSDSDEDSGPPLMMARQATGQHFEAEELTPAMIPKLGYLELKKLAERSADPETRSLLAKQAILTGQPQILEILRSTQASNLEVRGLKLTPDEIESLEMNGLRLAVRELTDPETLRLINQKAWKIGAFDLLPLGQIHRFVQSSGHDEIAGWPPGSLEVASGIDGASPEFRIALAKRALETKNDGALSYCMDTLVTMDLGPLDVKQLSPLRLSMLAVKHKNQATRVLLAKQALRTQNRSALEDLSDALKTVTLTNDEIGAFNQAQLLLVATKVRNPETQQQLAAHAIESKNAELYATLNKQFRNMAVLDPEFKEQVLHAVIAARRQAVRAGAKQRLATVKPSDLKAFLESELHKSPFDSAVLSKTLAREILKFAQSPEYFEGHGHRKSAGEEHLFFEEGQQALKLPTDAWVRRTQDGRGVEIELKTHKLGEGTAKEVYASKVIKINLSHEAQVKSSIDSAIVYSKGYHGDRAIQEGARIFNQIPEVVRGNPDFRVAGLPTNIDRKGPTYSIEATDVPAVNKWWKVPGGAIEYYQQILQVTDDVATTLGLLHQAGYIHGDVKANNILGREEKGKLRGHLADWDTLGKADPEAMVVGTPEHIDILTQNRIATPLTDIFALSVTTEDIVKHGEYGQSLELTTTQKQALDKLQESAQAVQAGEAQDRLLTVFKNQRLSAEQIHQKAMEIMNSDDYPYKAFLKMLKDCKNLLVT